MEAELIKQLELLKISKGSPTFEELSMYFYERWHYNLANEMKDKNWVYSFALACYNFDKDTGNLKISRA